MGTPYTPELEMFEMGDTIDLESLDDMLSCAIQRSPVEIPRMKQRTKELRDQILAQGGRPSRPIRLQPSWKSVSEEGKVLYIDADTREECLVNKDMLLFEHWWHEAGIFEGEADLWEEFRASNPMSQALNSNARLQEVMRTINDWRLFELWHQTQIECAVNKKQGYLRNIMDKRDKKVQQRRASEEGFCEIESDIYEILDLALRAMKFQEELLAKRHVYQTWIQGQYVEIFEDAVSSLALEPNLLQELEQAMQQYLKNLHDDMENNGMNLAHQEPDFDQSPNPIQRLCHLQKQTTMLESERREWQTFLQWKENTHLDIQQDDDTAETHPLLANHIYYLREEHKRLQGEAEWWAVIAKWLKREIRSLPYPQHVEFYSESLPDIQRAVNTSKDAAQVADSKLTKAIHSRISLLEERISNNNNRRNRQSLQGVYDSPPESDPASQSQSKPETARTELDLQPEIKPETELDMDLESIPTYSNEKAPSAAPSGGSRKLGVSEKALTGVQGSKVKKPSQKKPSQRKPKGYTEAQRQALTEMVEPTPSPEQTFREESVATDSDVRPSRPAFSGRDRKSHQSRVDLTAVNGSKIKKAPHNQHPKSKRKDYTKAQANALITAAEPSPSPKSTTETGEEPAQERQILKPSSRKNNHVKKSKHPQQTPAQRSTTQEPTRRSDRLKRKAEDEDVLASKALVVEDDETEKGTQGSSGNKKRRGASGLCL